MKKSEIKLTILEILAILLLFLNIFVKNILNEYTIIIFIGIFFVISLCITGFEKEKVLEKKIVMKIVIFYTLAFLILIYSLGLFTGYVKTSYSLKLVNIMKNLFPVILLIIVEELFRYHVCKKGEKNKKIIVLSIIIFILTDVSVVIHQYNLSNVAKIIELITVIVCPSIFKNTMLTLLAYKYGYKVCIIYQLIMNIYLYIMPIFPNLSLYLQSVIMTVFPLFIGLVIYFRFKEEKIEDFNNKHIIPKIITAIIILMMIVMIVLYSNLFSYTVAVIGSGSMTPTIKVGDIIIIDKTYQEKIDKLAVGDVLVFKIKDKLYTHRIVAIKEKNGIYSISTQGDRKGQAVDTWTVTNDDIIGVAKLKIPKLGYPSIWLNRLMEE